MEGQPKMLFLVLLGSLLISCLVAEEVSNSIAQSASGSQIPAKFNLGIYDRALKNRQLRSEIFRGGARNSKLQKPNVIEVVDFLEDEDVFDGNSKRFDDYGHMRFGKRNNFEDDYGHMRFGKKRK